MKGEIRNQIDSEQVLWRKVWNEEPISGLKRGEMMCEKAVGETTYLLHNGSTSE